MSLMDEPATQNSPANRSRGSELLRPFSPQFLGLLVLGIMLACYFGFRWTTILEDAFISLRYSKHLYEGYGPVYNPGEQPVEGYTNFLWMLIMSAHYFFTDTPEKMLLYYNRAFGILIIVAVWWELIARASSVRQWTWLGVGLVASHQTLHSWMAGGLETHFFAMLITLGIGRFLREEFDADGPRRPLSAVIISIALLTRPEAYIFGLLCGTCLIFRRLVRASSVREGWMRVFIWGGICALIGGSHLLWRHHYYGDWLPNTFYAKASKAYFESGIPYVRMFLEFNYYRWEFIAIILLLNLAIVLPPFRRNPIVGQALVLSAAIAVFGVYIAYAGGDVFEFRLLTPVVPLIGLVVPITFAWISEQIPTANVGVRLLRFSLGIILSIAGCGLIARELYTAHHLNFADALRSSLAGSNTMSMNQGWDFGTKLHPVGLWFREYGRKPERLAVWAAGVVPYYSELPTLDMHGLNDRNIARMPLTQRKGIGHEKAATQEYLIEQKVVYIFEDLFFQEHPNNFPPEIRSDDHNVIFRLFTGYWTKFRTLSDTPDALRALLRERGAIIYPGPREDILAAERANDANWQNFLKLANKYDFTPSYSPPMIRIESDNTPGQMILGDFEIPSWQGWVPEGDAFGASPTFGRVGLQMEIVGQVGNGLVNSFHPQHGDGVTGRLRSPSFSVLKDMTLTMRVGGGVEGVGVALTAEGQRLQVWTGNNSENMVNVIVDLSPWLGRELQVEVFDDSTGNWGHVLADEFILRAPELNSPAKPTDLGHPVTESGLSLTTDTISPDQLTTPTVGIENTDR